MLRRGYDDLIFGEFYTWGRKEVEWGALCSHRSIEDGPSMEDLELNEDQRAELGEACAEPSRSNARERTRDYR